MYLDSLIQPVRSHWGKGLFLHVEEGSELKPASLRVAYFQWKFVISFAIIDINHEKKKNTLTLCTYVMSSVKLKYFPSQADANFEQDFQHPIN